MPQKPSKEDQAYSSHKCHSVPAASTRHLSRTTERGTPQHPKHKTACNTYCCSMRVAMAWSSRYAARGKSPMPTHRSRTSTSVSFAPPSTPGAPARQRPGRRHTGARVAQRRGRCKNRQEPLPCAEKHRKPPTPPPPPHPETQTHLGNEGWPADASTPWLHPLSNICMRWGPHGWAQEVTSHAAPAAGTTSAASTPRRSNAQYVRVPPRT